VDEVASAFMNRSLAPPYLLGALPSEGMSHLTPPQGGAPAAPDNPGENGAGGGEPTVLVVDDDFEIRDLLREAFEDEGCRVLTAAKGREALALLRQRPDCVVLDIHMPVMNGVELYHAMRADPAYAELPVIITTSDPAKAPRGVPLMRKPLDLDGLIEAVRSA